MTLLVYEFTALTSKSDAINQKKETILNNHILATPAPCAQPLRRRYSPDFVGPRPPKGRPKQSSLTFSEPLPPLSNTGGKLKKIKCHLPLWKKKSNAFSCQVDWLTFMIPAGREIDSSFGRENPFDPDDNPDYRHPGAHDRTTVSDYLSSFLDCLIYGINVFIEPTTPRKFFTNGWKLRHLTDDGEIGPQLAWVGIHQSTGKWMVDISGECCPFWDFQKLSHILQLESCTLTRLDLAADDYDGVCGVPYAMRIYKLDGFITNGRNPSTKFISEQGARTFYIGRRENGKQLCIYEKGKQLKSEEHPDWVRWELRLGNKDRIIPYEAMREPARYFLGSFHPLPSIFPNLTNATPEHISTKAKEKASGDLAHGLFHLRRCFGPVLHQAEGMGVPLDALFQALRRPPSNPIPFLDPDGSRSAVAKLPPLVRS